MLLKYDHVRMHPVYCVRMYLCVCVVSWGRWIDKCRESGDLSEHTWGEGVCGNGSVFSVFMMCGMDECEVMFGKLSGGWV